MPSIFLTSEQALWAVLGEPNEVQLARYFHLDEADLAFIDKPPWRSEPLRCGFAARVYSILGLWVDLSRVPVNTQWFRSTSVSPT